MSLGRMMSVLSGVALAGGVALAQPKAPAPAPAAPGAPAAPATGSADGSAVAPIEDAPPSDMEGRDENPGNPAGDEPTTPTTAAPVTVKKSGYPIEETARPITLPKNMGEVSIGPHFRSKPFQSSDALRFRFGITGQIQLGLTYLWGGFYDADLADGKSDVKFHAGKAAGVDVTVLITNWLGVSVGVPVYLDPIAVALTAGAPMKFLFGKVAVGGLEDVLAIKLHEFPPSLYNEAENALGAANKMTGSEQTDARLRFAGFAEYQQSPKLAFIGRIGLERQLHAGGGGAAGTSSVRDTQTFLRAGLQFSPKRFVDVGASLGLDDLSTINSFGLAGFLALRI